MTGVEKAAMTEGWLGMWPDERDEMNQLALRATLEPRDAHFGIAGLTRSPTADFCKFVVRSFELWRLLHYREFGRGTLIEWSAYIVCDKLHEAASGLRAGG